MSFLDEEQSIEINVDLPDRNEIANYKSCYSIRRWCYIDLPEPEKVVDQFGHVVMQRGFVTVMNHFYNNNWIPISDTIWRRDLSKRAIVYETSALAEAELGDLSELYMRDPGDLIINRQVSDEEYRDLLEMIVDAPKDAEISIYANSDDKLLTFLGVFKLDSIESILQHRLILRFQSDTDNSLTKQ